jgi:hypothetical protein
MAPETPIAVGLVPVSPATERFKPNRSRLKAIAAVKESDDLQLMVSRVLRISIKGHHEFRVRSVQDRSGSQVVQAQANGLFEMHIHWPEQERCPGGCR